MKVAAVQHDIVWEDPEANFELLGPKVAQAAADGARLVVLSEMYSTGFSMASDKVAEPPDGPSVGFLADQAAACGVWVCGSVPVSDPSKAELPFNRFVLAGPDGVKRRSTTRSTRSPTGRARALCRRGRAADRDRRRGEDHPVRVL